MTTHKLTCLSTDLRDTLARVISVVPARNVLPILSQVMLTCEEGAVIIFGTDLQVAVRAKMTDCDFKSAWSVCLPAQTLHDWARVIPTDAELSLVYNSDKQSVALSCAGFKARVAGTGSEEFPVWTESQGRRIVISSDVLAKMARQVLIAVAPAKEIGRPALQGILIRAHKDQVTLVSADGYRLALYQGIEQGVDYDQEAVVPSAAWTYLLKILASLKGLEFMGITISPDGSRIWFELDGVTLVSMTVQEHQFPDYNSILPTNYATRTTVDRVCLTRALNAAAIFAGDTGGRVLLHINDGKIIVVGSNSERGSTEISVPAQIKGEGLDVGLNVACLLDFLKVVDDPEVEIGLNNPTSPVRLAGTTLSPFQYLQMPMHLP